MIKTILMTGGAGFIGHHVAEHLLLNTDHNLVFLDRLDISGNLNRIAEVLERDPSFKARCKFIFHDLKAEINDYLGSQIGCVDVIIHLAAGTHVDRSITNPLEFVYDNVVGTANLLEFARSRDIEQMIYFSTDEIFGPAPKGVMYKEWDRYNSGNPYSATKAGAEELCLAYHNTYKTPVKITHCMNIFGERQHPEKFIPMTIANVRDGKTVIVHADKTKTISGSRFYIHARNVANALMFIMDKGVAGDKYNIVGDREVSNLELAQLIADIQGKTLYYEMVDFHSSRPGHDLRYALDGTKLKEMGWNIPMTFDASLRSTINWSLKHSNKWLI
jgi:dTDP-glucose 4,6-dehydratase